MQAESCKGQSDDQCAAAAALPKTDCAHWHACAEQPGELYVAMWDIEWVDQALKFRGCKNGLAAD